MAWQSFLAMGESTLHVLPRKWEREVNTYIELHDTDTHLAVVVEESQYYQYSRNHTLPVVIKMKRRKFITIHSHGLSSPQVCSQQKEHRSKEPIEDKHSVYVEVGRVTKSCRGAPRRKEEMRVFGEGRGGGNVRGLPVHASTGGCP